VNKKHFLSPEFIDLARHVRALIAASVVIGRGQTEVSLGVNGVVVNPVGDRGDGNTALEHGVALGVGSQCGEGHETYQS